MDNRLTFLGSRRAVRPAFTLVELLVVIAIIGVLIALLLPAVQAAREAARRAECQNKIKQLCLACQNHHDTFNRFPAAIAPITYGSWVTQVLPFFEEQALSDMIEPQPMMSEHNYQVEETPLPQIVCPSTGDQLPSWVGVSGFNPNARYEEASRLRSHYVGVMGAKYERHCTTPATAPLDYPIEMCDSSRPQLGGWANTGVMFPLSKIRFKHIVDGSSKTMLLAELSWIDSGPSRAWVVGTQAQRSGYEIRETENLWVYNAENIAHPMRTAKRNAPAVPPRADTYGNNDTSLGSEHPGGAHVALADGSVQFMTESVSFDDVIRPYATRNSSEVTAEAF